MCVTVRVKGLIKAYLTVKVVRNTSVPTNNEQHHFQQTHYRRSSFHQAAMDYLSIYMWLLRWRCLLGGTRDSDVHGGRHGISLLGSCLV